jgi:hypothetical protein
VHIQGADADVLFRGRIQMGYQKTYDNYPCWIIIVSNLVLLGTYLTGGYIIFHFGVFWLFLYVIYISVLEIRLMKKSCVNCYYYGKYCAFGKGKIASLLFKKGDPANFNNCKIYWKDLIPDFLVTLIPVMGGVALLVLNFNGSILASVILLAILASFGNAFVRGNIACKFCRQRELGCPAEQLFHKNM